MSAFDQASRITPFLWFEHNAEEAVDFYLGIFQSSRKIDVLRNPGALPGAEGTVVTIAFELDGTRFTALNGGTPPAYTEAVSFVVRCDSQQEIDFYWEKLVAGGSPIACGWLKDKFGVRWQIVPANIAELVRSRKGMEAMMTMTKFDVAALERAGKE